MDTKSRQTESEEGQRGRSTGKINLDEWAGGRREESVCKCELLLSGYGFLESSTDVLSFLE